MVKNLSANAGDARDACLILETGRYPRVGNSPVALLKMSFSVLYVGGMCRREMGKR